MKILHTSDWHIGKRLHKYELKKDFLLFINWLISLIEDEKIEVILISGDLFDISNPSADARTQYFKALLAMHRLDCTIIITGGNHDSPSMLNAPKQLLNALNIHVVGGLPNNLEDLLIPLKNPQGDIETIVAAVPYLLDSELHRILEGQKFDNHIDRVQKGIENTFLKVAHLSKEKYPNIPIIAMGHLFTAGVSQSDSEKEIQIGNAAKFDAQNFGQDFSYMALGHIHKPQKVNGPCPIYYSGSPYPLSFSERKNNKRVLILDTKIGFTPKSVSIPAFRELLHISGNLEEIETKLQSLNAKRQLESLIEIELTEENFNVEKLYQLDQIINDFEQDGYEIVHRKPITDKDYARNDSFFETGISLHELEPKEVFNTLIEEKDYNEETLIGLQESFQLILEEVQQEN